MSDKPPDYKVGYGKPPKHGQWQKGQSGNPKRIYKRLPKTVLEVIDNIFASEIGVVENGTPRRISGFEAIALQLCIRATAGNKRAMKVLLRYQSFAKSRVGKRGYRIVVVSDDYSKILRTQDPDEEDDHD